MQLVATFPKTATPRRVAEFRWSDGTVATTPVYGSPARLPHDLDHYIVATHVELPYGFWALAGKKMPFNSFTLVSGRWDRGARAQLERVARKHRGAMLQAEADFAAAMADDDVDVGREWPTVRRQLARLYAYEAESPFGRLRVGDVERMVAFYKTMHAAWDDVPLGGALRVTWPGRQRPAILGATVMAGGK